MKTIYQQLQYVSSTVKEDIKQTTKSDNSVSIDELLRESGVYQRLKPSS